MTENASGSNRIDDALRLDPAALELCSEPAAILDSDGLAIRVNAAFSAALGLLTGDGARASSAVLAAIAPSAADAPPGDNGPAGGGQRGVLVGPPGKFRIFDIIALPLATPGWRLVMALDRTVDVSLRNALAGSRARFKGLVEVSSDYAWETNEDGTFGMVTPRGLAGWAAKDLIGSQPNLLFDPGAPQPAISPFATPMPVDGVEVWMRHVDGHALCFEISAVPLYDGTGAWRGARGVCHDVTQDRKDRAYLAELRERDRVFARITNVFRREADPDEMLQVAASTSTHGFGANGCQIFTAQAAPAAVVTRPVLTLTAIFGNAGGGEPVDPVLERLLDDDEDDVWTTRQGGWSVLAARAIYAGRLVGTTLLWRAPDRKPWADGDIRLLQAVSGQVAAAIEQRANFHMLFDASRSDPLTGVLNRRGFYDEMKRRFRRLQRDTKTAALVYFDLDNFKLVNDVHGHAKGDDALRHLADILRHNTRSTDLVARLGGDEFAVWLDGADEAVAINRAQVFLAAASGLLVYSGRPDRPLKLSMGIAVHDPKTREDINQFVSRADMAMYSVKRGGKGSFALAAPAGGAS